MKKYPLISKPMILQSNAGYYIGKAYYHSEDEYEPYSRLSIYYETFDDANRALIDNDYIDNFNEY